MTENPQEVIPEPTLWSAAYVHGFRLARGLTVDALARRSGVDRSTIAKVEAGDLAVRPSTVGRLADALDVPLWRLWVLPTHLAGAMERDPVAAFPQSDPEPEESDGEPAKPKSKPASEPTDVAQEVGARILARVPPVDPGDNVHPALYAIAEELAPDGEVDQHTWEEWADWWAGQVPVDELRTAKLRGRLRTAIKYAIHGAPDNDNEEE